MENTKDKILFTIDLLKGQGIPIKSRPEGIVVAAVAFVIPAVVAIVMLGWYLSTGTSISIQKQKISSYEEKISKLSKAVELYNSFEEEKKAINNCLSEVSSSIKKRTQWSPVLAMLVKNLPDSLVLKELEVKRRSTKKSLPKKDDPQTMVDVSVLVETLHMTVSGNPWNDSDEAIRLFKDRIRSSDLLGEKLEDIRISQEFNTTTSQNAVSYDIDCIFKPKIIAGPL